MRCKHARATERTPLVLMDRVYGESRELINRLSIAGVSYEVFAYPTREDAEADRNGEQVGTAANLDPSVVVFDELQTAGPWDVSKDADGYNFRFTLPPEARPAHGWHVVQIWLTPSTEGHAPYPLVWYVESTPLAAP